MPRGGGGVGQDGGRDRAGEAGRRVPTPVLWVGELPWGDPRAQATQRQARAWAEAGAPVLYLDPDPGPIRWSGGVPAAVRAQDASVIVWREFLAVWFADGMRADGPVWVLPWVRSLVCADGVVRSEPAAVVEGLAELAAARPVVVAAQAGRWAGRSPTVAVVHRPVCLGDPPARVEPGWRARPAPWTEPWLRVVIWGTPDDEAWANDLAGRLPEAQIHRVGMGRPDAGSEANPPGPDLLAGATVLVVSPGRAEAATGVLPHWLSAHPQLRVIGPLAAPRGSRAERVLAVRTAAQYMRALGAAVWLPPTRLPVVGPWEGVWRALAQSPCPRCVS